MPKKRRVNLRAQFGFKLRKLRRDAGLTQEQLAEKAHISVDFLSLIERGRNAPSFENIEHLVNALEVSFAEMFSFEAEP